MSKKENSNNTTVCSLLNLAFGKFLNFLLNINLNKTINVYHINKDSLGLSFNNKEKLYCVRLINDSNVYREYINFNQLQESIKFDPNAKYFQFFVKKGLHQAIYIFTLNEDIARQIGTDFNTKLLSGSKIIEAIHDIFLIPEREIKDNSYVNTEYVNELDVLYKQLPSRISIATHNIFRKYNIYQGVSYHESQQFNPVTFFNRNWNGVFSIMVDFSASSIQRHMKIEKDGTTFGDKKMHNEVIEISEKPENKEIFEDLKNQGVVVNSILYIDNIDEISALQSELKISFQENYFTSPQILPKTLINKRDTTFDMLIPSYLAKKYMISTHKEVITKVRKDRKRNQLPDFYGKDINSAFVNYSYYGENSTPHVLMVGLPGSGKSTSICKKISHYIGLDIINNTINQLNDVNVKYCDVGYTAGGLFEKIREIVPNETQVIDSRIENLKFSLFDIEKNIYGKADEEDVKFATYFIDTIFAVSNIETLRTGEEEKLIESIKEIVENDYYLDLTLGEINTISGFEEEVKKMYEKGYEYYNKISDLKEKEYQKFKKPTLKSLIYFLQNKSTRSDLTHSKKAIFENLITKLENITSYQNFSTWSNVDFEKNFPIQYIDFDKIKDDPKLFTSTFWMLFKRWYKRDKEEAIKELNKGKTPKTSYYIIEEAHNFLCIPAFKNLLDVASREARKYFINLIFVTQKLDDIPNDIFNSISTRIFLFPMEKKQEVKNAIEKKIGNENEPLPEHITNVFNRIKKHQMFIYHDAGATGCDLMLTDEELALFIPREIY